MKLKLFELFKNCKMIKSYPPPPPPPPPKKKKKKKRYMD